MHVSACTARPTSSPSFRNWRPPMPEPPPKRKPPSNQELIRAVWEEARDLVKRLEGSTVQRFSVEAGDTKIEIERRAIMGSSEQPAVFTTAAGATDDDG